MTDHAAAFRRIAVEAYTRGDHKSAIEAFREALAHAPEDSRLHFEASVPHLALDELDAALRRLTDSLRLDPNNIDARLNAGLVSTKLGDRRGARLHFTAALALDPNQVQAANNLAVLLIRSGERENACALLQHAVDCDPDHRPSRQNLAGLLHYMGRFEEAAAQYRAILKVDPSDVTARFLLGALSGDSSVQQKPPPESYVRSLFDTYAETFETDLVNKLGYAAPEFFGRMIAGTLGAGARIRKALDIGCGTGLAAPHLRPFTETLVGVDLSPEMLVRAAARDQYDSLVEADGIAYMRDHPGADLVLAADLLIYLGAPSAFLDAAAGALVPGGLLALSTEAASDQEAGSVLRSSGRFAHRRDSLIADAEKAGLVLVTCESINLRAGENGVQIPGDLFLFRKQSR